MKSPSVTPKGGMRRNTSWHPSTKTATESMDSAAEEIENRKLLGAFLDELQNDKFYANQVISRKEKIHLAKDSWWNQARRWLVSKGGNGGVMPNGGVIICFSIQMWAWYNSAGISRWAAKALCLPKGMRRPGSSDSFMDRLIGYFVENGAVMTLCNLRSLLPHPQPIEDTEAKGTLKNVFMESMLVLSRNIAISVISNMIAEEGAVFLHHLTSTKLYSKVPYFRQQMNSANPLELGAFKDWIWGNGVLQLVGGGLCLGFVESLMPKEAADEITETPFSILGFLKNFAIFRVVVDVCFYCGHRMLHENNWLYQNIHKRHHLHYTTNLRTNYMFHPIDLFIESAFPIFAGIVFLRKGLGIKMSRYEIHLMMTYVAWHEAGTHLGKPLPVISTYPPLSILYTAFTDAEKHSIEFHEVHHNRRRTNYGITQWIDLLMGSRMLKSNVRGSLTA